MPGPRWSPAVVRRPVRALTPAAGDEQQRRVVRPPHLGARRGGQGGVGGRRVGEKRQVGRVAMADPP
ncbi:hypothetical protein [Streptomyces prunicolor]|uniref:hypothetical protein n=1 Tax=Streptomyces prunicolor TaxID=67348 RepID=UPI00131A289A|nr:hypothetical protein [Streptomyces prunicolor]